MGQPVAVCGLVSARRCRALCQFRRSDPARADAAFPEWSAETDRINALAVADLAGRPVAELIGLLRDNAEPHGLGAGFGGRVALTDNMIHQQDIRRPLGIPRTIAPDRLHAALDFVRYAPTIRGAWRARGVTLIATDLDWSYGRGPEVRGTGEALLLVMAGRAAALSDLDGPGKGKLVIRL